MENINRGEVNEHTEIRTVSDQANTNMFRSKEGRLVCVRIVKGMDRDTSNPNRIYEGIRGQERPAPVFHTGGEVNVEAEFNQDRR